MAERINGDLYSANIHEHHQLHFDQNIFYHKGTEGNLARKATDMLQFYRVVYQYHLKVWAYSTSCLVNPLVNGETALLSNK